MRTKDPHPNPGSILLFYRHNEGKTQRQLAKEVGLRAADISRFERGVPNMAVWKARALANHMGIRIDDFVRDNYAPLLKNLTHIPIRSPEMRERRRNCQLKKLDTGDMGEHFVADNERRLLAGTPYADGVNEGCADDFGAGYDIFSFTTDGKPKFLEVKSTTGDLDDPFFISDGELKFARFCLEQNLHYELHRVYYLNNDSGAEVKVYTAQELLTLFDFEVNDYLVTRRKSA